MDHDITIIENFLSDDECDFLIDFFKKASHKEVWESTSILWLKNCLLYTSPSPRDGATSRMPSSA